MRLFINSALIDIKTNLDLDSIYKRIHDIIEWEHKGVVSASSISKTYYGNKISLGKYKIWRTPYFPSIGDKYLSPEINVEVFSKNVRIKIVDRFNLVFYLCMLGVLIFGIVSLIRIFKIVFINSNLEYHFIIHPIFFIFLATGLLIRLSFNWTIRKTKRLFESLLYADK